jgi:uncharacterized protein (TIGR02145 family)
MKKIYSFLMSVLLAVSLMAQAPQSFNYQAVVRNADGEIIESTLVGMRISILQGSINGTVICTEEFSPTTNAFGLVTLAIGSVNTSGFGAIDWSAGHYFVKVELDPAGGTNYTNMGTSQLISVPYALYAKTSETAIDAVLVTGDQTISGNKTFTGTIDVDNKVITNAGTPVNTTDVANKAYVDAVLVKILDIQAEQGVKDFDGNEYKAVRIGNQVWMAENLRTTKYSDGTAIPLKVIDNNAWINLSTPGYCWWNNDSATYSVLYGAIYNWYAVNTGKLCPTGWHVPTDADWTLMENYLIANGYNYDGTNSGNKIAKSLAAATNWPLSSNTGAPGNTDYPSYCNKTGFTALPVPCRGLTFDCCEEFGKWWSASKFDNSSAWLRVIYYDKAYVERTYYLMVTGLSARCVKD